MMKVLNTKTTLKVETYRWLRWPAILLAGVGVWGILAAKLNMAAKVGELFNLPPIDCCYFITAGAAVLLGISLFYRQPQKEHHETHPADSESHRYWRSR